MSNSVYQINKGINRSIEFKGLRAQYIWYLAGCIIFLLIAFAILYFIGLNTYLTLFIIGVAGAFSVMKVYALSTKYGEYGLMKLFAQKAIPSALRCNSRALFINVKGKGKHQFKAN